MTITVEITETDKSVRLTKKMNLNHRPTCLEEATANLMIAHINVLLSEDKKRRESITEVTKWITSL